MESLEQRLALTGFDFGDAPAASQSGFGGSYPTLNEQDGAAHLAVGPRLGNNRTASDDGQPDPGALGDIGTNEGLSYAELSLRVSEGERQKAIAAGDLNNDGIPDVVVGSVTESVVTVTITGAAGAQDETHAIDLDSCTGPALEVADFNRDGNADIVVSCFGQSSVLTLIGAGDGTFGLPTRVDLNGGRSPNSLAVADFDLDGNLDLATANSSSRDLSVLFGAGDGSFALAAGIDLPDEVQPRGIVAGDIDGDGMPDVAFLEYTSSFQPLGTASVFFSEGDRTFDERHGLDLGGADLPFGLVAADINQDGTHDLITANLRSKDVSILASAADRTFHTPRRIWLDGAAPIDVVAVDLDSDGLIDIATTSLTSGVSALMGTGGGEFSTANRVALGVQSEQIVSADFNVDGAADLLIDTRYGFAILIGNGDGAFEIPFENEVSRGDNPRAIAVADLNADGIADAAVVNDDGVAVALGSGDGSFPNVSHLRVPGTFPRDIAIEDVNGDSIPDIAVGVINANAVFVFVGLGDGKFAHPLPAWLSLGNRPQHLILADFNGDGHIDIATANLVSDDVSLLPGNGDGTFQADQRIDMGDIDFARDIIARDFNGDGTTDIATLNQRGESDITVVLNDGTGAFGPAISSSSQFSFGTSFVAADLDRDGNLDLVTVSEFLGIWGVWWGTGDGGFVGETHVVDSSSDLAGVGVTDWNLDGVPDIVFADSGNDQAAIVEGLGDRAFASPALFDLAGGIEPEGLAVADVDTNGRPDLITANLITHDVTAILNQAPYEVSSHNTNIADNPQALDYGDINGDGHHDVVVANADSDDLTVRLGFGDGTFHEPTIIPLQTGKTPRDVVVRDINGDGLLDVATANIDSNNISLLIGLGDGTFRAPEALALDGAEEPYGLAVEDFDQDGRVDLMTVNLESEDVTILKGQSDGSFVFSEAIATRANFSGTRPRLKALDFNGDSFVDLAVLPHAGQFGAVLLNDRGGSFDAAQTIVAPGRTRPCVWNAGDTSGDGVPDLLTSCEFQRRTATEEPHVAVFVQNGLGDGRFAAAETIDLGTDLNQNSLLLGDVDSDGQADLVLVHSHGSSNEGGVRLSILTNRNGSFRSNEDHPFTTFDGLSMRGEAALADLNRDGALDFLAADGTVALGNGDATFRISGGTRFQRGSRPDFAAVGDLNDDGLPDLVAGDSADMVILLAGGPGEYNRRSYESYNGTRFVDNLAIGDVTGDGLADIVGGGHDSISIYPGNGDGTIRPGFHLPFRADHFLLRDLNRDGRLDILAASDLDRVTILLGGEGGQLSAPINIHVSTGFSRLAVADVNSDGIPDILANDLDLGGFSVIVGRGDGSFEEPVGFATPEVDRVGGLETGDYNGDGNADVLLWNRTTVAVAHGGGDGTFQAASVVWSPSNMHELTSGDLNGDGTSDIVFYDPATGHVVLLNRGDSSFEELNSYDLHHNVAGLVLEDLNNDENLDLISLDWASTELHVVAGAGDGSLGATAVYETDGGGGTEFARVTDVNADGIQDVVTVNEFSNDVAVLIGHGDGSFQHAVLVPIVNSPSMQATVSVDLDADGLPEVLSASAVDHQLQIASATLAATIDFPEQTDIQSDLNGDGELDAVVVESRRLEILLGNGDGTFRGWIPEPTAEGSLPWDTLVVDLNNDGRLDIVTGNRVTDDLTVFLSDSQGMLGSPTRIHGLRNLLSVAHGDLDNDGNVDLIVGQNHASIRVLRGNGDGTFEFAAFVGSCLFCFARQIAVEDLDEDGNLDLVVATDPTFRGKFVAVSLGNGDGTFQDAIAYPAGSLNNLALGDVDGDGTVDIVTVNANSDEVAIRAGNGDGTFQEALKLGAGDFPVGLAVGDLNEDGLTDIVAGNLFTEDLSLFLSSPSGPALTRTLPLDGAEEPREVIITDVNADGLRDIVALTTITRDVSVLLNIDGVSFRRAVRLPYDGASSAARLNVYDPDGDGLPSLIVTDPNDDALKILSPVEPLKPPIRSQIGHLLPTSVVLNADLDGDGNPDAVTVHPESNEIGVRLGRDDGSFTEAAVYHLGQGSSPADAVLSDINQDGREDLLAVSSATGDITRLFGNGDGSFQQPEVILRGLTADRIVAGELNGDGLPDLAVTDPLSNTVTVLLGTGGGAFQPQDFYGLQQNKSPVDVAVGDFNGDGAADVATANSPDNSVSWWAGDGAGGLGDEVALTLAHVSQPRMLAAADLNGDGNDDLAVLSDDNLAVLLGSGSGLSLHATRALPSGAASGHGIDIRDADNDGVLDLLVAHSRKSFVFPGNGDGSFQTVAVVPSMLGVPHATLHRGTIAQRIGAGSSSLADFNHDGLLDLAIAHDDTPDLSVLVGNGDGSFTDHLTIPLHPGAAVSQVVSADVDGDGNVDLLAANPGTGGWSLFAGNGDATFAPPIAFDEARAGWLAVGDLNGDSLVDVVSTTAGNGIFIWLGEPGAGALPILQGHLPVADSVPSANVAALQLADINADGALDILQIEMGGDVLIFLGDGSGHFASPQTVIDPINNGRQHDRQLKAADLNGDGHIDLVVRHAFSTEMALHFGRGDGTFNPPVVISSPVERGGDLGVADVDGDGDLDLVVASGFVDLAGFLLNRGDGTFSPGEFRDLPPTTGISQLYTSDLNLDGIPDLTLARRSGVLALVGAGDDDGVAWLDAGKLSIAGVGRVRIDLQNSDVQANYLDAWIDFNRDGDWDDEDEQIFTSLNLGGDDGLQDLAFDIPATASLGNTYARFRLSSAGGLTPTGRTTDGEVEDYEVVIVPVSNLDFGDAPTAGQSGLANSYPTLFADDGARHIVGGPRIGFEVDSEPDGLAVVEANGDNAAGFDDEEGVSFSNLLAGQTGQVAVSVSQADGRLDAWIDFNLDGDWDDSGERIANSYFVPAGGERQITFEIPADAGGIQTYARFRVSSAGRLGSRGLAQDGEVEDHVVTIGNAPVPPDPNVLVAVAGGKPTVSDSGKSDFVTLRLNRPPSSEVTLTLTAQPDDELLVGTGSVTFDEDNWNVPQRVILSGVADSEQDGDQESQLIVTAPPSSEFATSIHIPVTSIDSTRLDFGNAGLGYPSSIQENGPRHLVSPLFLGATVAADDTSLVDPADNDGIVVIGQPVSTFNADTGASVGLTVSAAGLLDGWVDFNGDGDWEDEHEHIFQGLSLTAGSHQLPFVVPAAAGTGPTGARFRISSAGNLAPTGFAGDGEVEDYVFDVRQAAELDIDLSAGSSAGALATIRLDGEMLVVTNHGVELVRVPLSAFQQLHVRGSSGDDSITLDFPQELQEGLRIDTREGNDLLRWANVAATGVDNQAFEGVERIDLRNSQRDAIELQVIDGLSVPRVRVSVDAGDTFDSAAGWSLRAPLVENEVFYRVVERAALTLLIESDAPWQNPIQPLDVSGNRHVDPLDVLQIVNALNTTGSIAGLFHPSIVVPDDYRYLDVSGDNNLSPVDALLVINFLNGSTHLPPAEAEPSSRAPTPNPAPVFAGQPGTQRVPRDASPERAARRNETASTGKQWSDSVDAAFRSWQGGHPATTTSPPWRELETFVELELEGNADGSTASELL